MVTREMQKAEAIKRMNAMGVIQDAISQFDKNGTIMVSEPPFGCLYYLNDTEKNMVHEFEKENDALVYLVVRSFTNLGIMDNIFYVSKYEEEWEMDNADIDDGYALVYVVNYDMPYCSEFGSIAFNSIGGGVLRKF